MNVIYVTRAEWGAGPPGSLHTPYDPAPPHLVPHHEFIGLAIHHTVTPWDRTQASVATVAEHMQRLRLSRPDLGPEIPYSFVVFADADPTVAYLAEGRGYGYSGAHTSGYNSTRYGVSLAGNYEYDEVTPAVIEAINHVGWNLADPAGAVPAFPHSDVKATACPGQHMEDVMGQVQPPYYPPDPLEEYDMGSEPLILHPDPETRPPFPPGRQRFYVLEDQKLLGFNGAGFGAFEVEEYYGVYILDLRQFHPAYPITHIGARGNQIVCASRTDFGTFVIPMGP